MTETVEASHAGAAVTLAYRLVKKKWTHSAFDGEGAKRYGGRWNSRGRPCVYLASSESLVLLEVMMHIENYRVLEHYTLLELHLPKRAILTLSPDALPENWREDPAPMETAAVGDAWLVSGASLALAVPSAIVPREHNFLINPMHKDFSAFVATARELSFSPDPRLLDHNP